MVTEILLIILMLLANGVFAMSELAVMSARKARLQRRAAKGDAGAQAALELLGAPDRFLSTVQIGITLVGILAGAFGGATIAQELATSLSNVPWVGPYGEALGVLIVVLATTYLSLVLGELAPKRLALNNPERVASLVARPMQTLSRIATPLVRVLTSSTEGLLKLVGAKPSAEPPITEEEIGILIAQGIQAGVFEKDEHDMVERVLDLDTRRASSIMTPHTEIDWLDIHDPLEDAWRTMAGSGRSYFPVCENDLDHTLGIVSVKAVWAAMLENRAVDLRALAQPVIYIPESVPVLRVLRVLREKGQHMALVLGEHGGVEGLVTLKDVMEAMVGALPSREDDSDEAEVVKRADGTWLIDGLLSLDEFEALFDLEEHLRGEDRGGYQTLGGFVMAHVGRIPTTADRFDWHGYRFEVVDMDGRRVDKVLLTRLPGAPPDGPG